MAGLPTAVTLTDDEAVAVAVRLGRLWPSPLPTVDADSVADLMSAATRGRRSLSVRGLLSAEEGSIGRLHEELFAVVGHFLDDELRIVAYTSDRALAPDDLGPVYYFYGLADADEWLVEAVIDDGVHRLTRCSRRDAGEFLAALIAAVHQSGFEDRPDDDTALCVLRPGPPHHAVLVTRGELSLHVLRPVADGEMRSDPGPTGVHMTDATTWLGLSDI